MKKLALLAVLLGGLVLAAACGGGDNGEDKTSGEPAAEGEPTATATAEGTAEATAEATEEATPTSAAEGEPADSGIAGRLDEIVLGEGDAPGGLNEMMSMSMDMDFGFLPESAAGEGTAYMSMLASDTGEDMVMSMAFYFEDSEEVGSALGDMEDMSVEELENAFSMFGGIAGMEVTDTREIDVSGVGEGGFGFGMTLEMEELGAMDVEYVFFGEGSVMGMVVTMNMAGSDAADAVSLAKKMADKIEAVLE